MTDLLATAASAMDAQRAALDVTARNVAAAEAAGPNGSYARLIPQFSVEQSDDGAFVRFTGTTRQTGVNIDVLTEMIAAMNASRSYEADASLFDTGKRLAERTLDMGKL